MSVYVSVCERECGVLLDFEKKKKTLPCVHTKALCLWRGNDTWAEQKKPNTMLASARCWSYDTGKAPPTSNVDTRAQRFHRFLSGLIISKPKKKRAGSTSAVRVRSFICCTLLQHHPPLIHFLFLEAVCPLCPSLSQTPCVSHTQTSLERVAQVY